MAEAVAILRRAGLNRAMVSSSGDAGTRALHTAAPDLVLPSLRPYRRRGEIGNWTNDPSVIDFLEDRLKRFRWVASASSISTAQSRKRPCRDA